MMKMEINGLITKIEDGFTFVQTKRPEACKHCSSSGFCNKSGFEMRVNNNVNAKIGDEVIVNANESYKIYLLIGYIFIVPLIILFLGIYLFSLNSFLALLCLPMCILYFVFLKIINAKYKTVSYIVKTVDNPQNQ